MATYPWLYRGVRYVAGAAGRYLTNKAIDSGYHYARRKLGVKRRGRYGVHGSFGGPMTPAVSSFKKRSRGGRLMRSMKKSAKGKGGRRRKTRKTAKASPVSGFSFTYENGGSIDDTTCLAVGHCNMPAKMVFKAALGAIIRSLLVKVGILPKDPSVAVSDLTTNDAIIVYFRTNYDNSLTSASTVINTTTNSTISTMINDLFYNFETSYAGMSYTSQINFYQARFAPTTGSHLAAVNINLDGAKVTVSSKSSLKLQNRSTSGTENNDADVIDSIPITGKMYGGFGTGTRNRYSTGGAINTHAWVCDSYSGLHTSASTSGTLNRGYGEPPDARALADVRRTDPVRIAPGAIHFDNLYSTTSKSLDALFAKLQIPVFDTTLMKTPFGKFTIVCLEKVLEPENTVASRIPIEVAFEQSIKITVNLHLKKSNYLPPLNYVDQIASHV